MKLITPKSTVYSLCHGTRTFAVAAPTPGVLIQPLTTGLFTDSEIFDVGFQVFGATEVALHQIL